MIQKAIFSIFFGLTISILFIIFQILEEKDKALDKEISKYNLLIKKIKNVSNINKKLSIFIQDNKIKTLSLQNGEKEIISLFDKYKNRYGLKIKNYKKMNNKIILNLNLDSKIKNVSDSIKYANFFEKNRIDNVIVIHKTLKYQNGNIKSDLDFIIPFKGE